MIEPEIILPGQLFLRNIATPEKRLLLAVLEEAVGTFQREVVATDRQGRSVFDAVEAWFASEDTAWLFSFRGICDVLGLDATYVRSGLARWLEGQRAQPLETARSPYRFPFRRMSGVRTRPSGRAAGMTRHA